MAKYFKIVGIIELICFVGGLIYTIVEFFRLLPVFGEYVGGGWLVFLYILCQIIYCILGPALGLLFLTVSDHEEKIYYRQEKIEYTTSNPLVEKPVKQRKQSYSSDELYKLQFKYKEAEELIDQKQFDRAKKIFESLNDYKDSRDRAKECDELKNLYENK